MSNLTGDALLRACGFEILKRPEKGPNIWSRNKIEYLEQVAHDLIKKGVFKEKEKDKNGEAKESKPK